MTSPALDAAIAQFGEPRGYLAVASIGIPPRAAVEALTADLAAWAAADRDPQGYDGTVARTRASFAALVGVHDSSVAIGSQTSVLTSLVAAAAPVGAQILLPDGDFSSIMFPFLSRGDLDVRVVPLAGLADAVTESTWLVAFSMVQSATGTVADADSVVAAAARYGAMTFCDTTQAAGVLPVDASRFDVTVCHAYKWLCSPRGVAFITLSDRIAAKLTPVQSGWYAGADVWTSTYGPRMQLATDARRFDVSPAWQAWIGAEPAVALFAGLDMNDVWARTSGLGDALCEGLGIAPQHQAIVTWPDESGHDLHKLAAAGIRASGRAGRLRAAFHLWNDESDVEGVLKALAL